MKSSEKPPVLSVDDDRAVYHASILQMEQT